MDREENAELHQDRLGSEITLITADDDKEKEKDNVEFEKKTKRRHKEGETLIERLGLLDAKFPNNSAQPFDVRRNDIYFDLKATLEAAPKTALQKAEIKKPAIEQQLERSERELEELVNFGTELVTNIQVANEKRELLRSNFETERRAKVSADLSKQSIEALAKLNDLTARWTELQSYNEPVALYDKMEEQKQLVAALLKSKDNLIAQCEQENARTTAKFYSDQNQQAADVCCIVERVDNQIELIRNAYASHLKLLEDTIEAERIRIKEEKDTHWERFYEVTTKTEEHKFKVERLENNFYTEHVARISKSQEELTRGIRMRLEKEAEALELELRETGNKLLLMSEKMDYNHQVLTNSNMENQIINNQAKRRIGKLSAKINHQRKKINEAKDKFELAIRKQSLEIQKLHQTISQMEKKALQFRHNNKEKFNHIWAINFKDVTKTLQKIFEIDRILYEQQLFVSWTQPYVDFTDINATEKIEMSESELNFIRKSGRYDLVKGQVRISKRFESMEEKQIRVRFIRNVLRTLADRAGFLVEEKLLKILEPYTDKAKCVVRIDHIFSALRIEDMKNVKFIMKYFEPYSYCPNCGSPEQITKLTCYNLLEDVNKSRRSTMGSIKRGTQQDFKEFAKRRSTMIKNIKKCNNHQLLIEPMKVLTALRNYTSTFWAEAARPTLLSLQKELDNNSPLIDIKDTVIENFWRKFPSYISPEKHKLWKVLQHGLNHFMEVLKQRELLEKECRFLRKQNKELKYLLMKFKV